jgi:heme oxygenase
MTGKNVPVRDAVLRKRIQKGACNVVLASHIGEPLGAVFPGQNLISHALTRSLGRCG